MRTLNPLDIQQNFHATADEIFSANASYVRAFPRTIGACQLSGVSLGHRAADRCLKMAHSDQNAAVLEFRQLTGVS
jgi:hypothetical protein